MSDIGLKLQEKLNSDLLYSRLQTDQHQVSKDGTQKWLFKLTDDKKLKQFLFLNQIEVHYVYLLK